jgi:molybdate transport system ATP-binding protein
VGLQLHRFTLRAAFETDARTMGLFGNSGAGKTTLLEVLAGLRRGAAGRIEVDGAAWLDSDRGIDLPAERRGVGYVPQEGLLFPHWDVMGNVLAGAERARDAGATRIDPEQVIGVLDLELLRRRRAASLSGGERQRVALARALCSGPSLLLLDEPLASVEAPLRGRILRHLLAVRDAFSIPTVYVSHDATEVTVLCEEVAVLHEGRVRARGSPRDVFAAPAAEPWTPGAAYENVLEGTVVSVEESRASVSLGAGRFLIVAGAPEAAAGARALVGIRASDLMLAVAEPAGLSARNVLPGVIREIRPVDGGCVVRVDPGPGLAPVAVVVTEAARRALGLAEGLSVRLVAKAQSCRLIALR